jgi:hypothetical protein
MNDTGSGGFGFVIDGVTLAIIVVAIVALVVLGAWLLLRN